MDILFMLLFLVSFVGLVIGLIKPDLVLKFMDKEKRSRKKVLLIFGSTLIVSFILFGNSTDVETNKVVDNKPKKIVQKEEKPKEKEKLILSDDEKLIFNKTYEELEESEIEIANKIVSVKDQYSDEDKTLIEDYNVWFSEKEAKEKAEREVKEKAEREEKEAKVAEEKAKAEKIANAPREHKSALKKAEIYSSTMHMSKASIYDQLVSEYGENFPKEAAQYAIDNIEANWKENALKKAETYANSMSMSNAAVYDQLISQYGEKFTKEEAQYAIDNLE